MKRETLCTALVSLLFVSLTLPAQAQVSFFQPPTYAGSGQLFVADFNGDGKPDILTSDGTMNLGNGDGTFRLGTSLSGSPGSPVTVLAVADFNADGKPDVLEQGLGTLLVLLGNGDGTFQAPVSTASGASLSVVAATDLKGNGKADVVGVFGNYLFVYMSNGDGTFASGVSYNLGAASVSAALLSLGDFNGDGKIDAVVTMAGNNVPGQEIVLLGNGDGTFQTTPKISTGVNIWNSSAVVGDFNGDGKLDLVISAVSGFCNGSCIAPATTYFLLGNGDGTFKAPAVAFLGGGGPLVAADLNGDGKLDLVLESNLSFAQIYLGNGDGTFSNTTNYVLNMPNPYYGSGVNGIAIADFNLDGKLDIASGGSVQLGNGNGTFQGIPLGVPPNAPGPLAIGDFEKNGTPDVAVLSNQNVRGTTSYYVYILRNDGTGKLSLINTYTLQDSGFSIASGDFNGDGNLDLVVIGQDPITQNWGYSVLLGNGNGSFHSPVFYAQNVNGGGTTVVGDFNHDGKPDLAVADGQSVAILLGNGDGTFAPPVQYYDGGGGFLVTADFNGDGKLDLAVGGAPTALLFGNGDGTFQPAVFPSNLNSFTPVLTADFNNDGNPDLFSGGQVALGNGDGTFNLLPLLPNPALAVGDMNGDGKLDLVVNVTDMHGHPIGNGVQLGNGDGTFASLIPILSPGNILPAPYVADMNGDGRPDLVFVPENTSITLTVNGVAVLLNTTPASFAIAATALSPGTVTAGSSSTSTVSIKPTFGFTGAVTLSCTGLPTGATCTFNPASVKLSGNTSVNSSLLITTTASTPAGSYSIVATGTSGTTVNTTPMSLTINPAPDFTVAPASGSRTSQTISAGQKAMFSLAFGRVGGFTGSVSLTCGISPTVTPPPTCSLASSSVQIGSTAQTVTVTVATTAPVTTGTLSPIGFPPATMPLAWTALMLGSGWLFRRNRKRLPGPAAPLIVLAVALWVGCGGGGSSSHTTPGTPTGTYTATITATSGSLSHSMPLTVVVQ